MTTYSETDLGPYTKYSDDPDIDAGRIFAARDRGMGGDFNTHAAVWDGGWTLLPDPDTGADWTVATAGTGNRAVGLIYPSAQVDLARAALWEFDGSTWTLSLLPLPLNATGAAAFGISPDGMTVTGEVSMTDSSNRAAIWTDAGGTWAPTVLPQPDVRGTGFGATDAGVIYGTVLDRPVFQAVRWDFDGTAWAMTVLPAPGTPAPTDVYSGVYRTRGGLTAGHASVSGGPDRALIWDGANAVTDIGAGDETEATATNGTVVAGVDNSSGKPRAFAWSAADGLTNLHSGNGWSFPGAVDADGKIVLLRGENEAGDKDPTTRIVLLTPV